LSPDAVEIGADPASWFELGNSYASLFEVVLVSLALVYYAADMPSGKQGLISFFKASSMIHKTIKGVIRVGPLLNRGAANL